MTQTSDTYCKVCNKKNVPADQLCDGCWEIEYRLKDYINGGGHYARKLVLDTLFNVWKDKLKFLETNPTTIEDQILKAKIEDDLRHMFLDIFTFHFDTGLFGELVIIAATRIATGEELDFYLGVLKGMRPNIILMEAALSAVKSKMKKYIIDAQQRSH